MVELDDHPGVEKPAWGHKWLQGVPLHPRPEDHNKLCYVQSEFSAIGSQWKRGRLMIKARDRFGGRSLVEP